MKQNLHHYVGRIVRLNKSAYQDLRRRAIRQGLALENSFVVAEFSRKLRKLICYGASFRIVVDVTEVVLV